MESKKTTYPVPSLFYSLASVYADGRRPLIEWLIKMESKKTICPVTFFITPRVLAYDDHPPLIEWLVKIENKKTTFLVTIWLPSLIEWLIKRN